MTQFNILYVIWTSDKFWRSLTRVSFSLTVRLSLPAWDINIYVPLNKLAFDVYFQQPQAIAILNLCHPVYL